MLDVIGSVHYCQVQASRTSEFSMYKHTVPVTMLAGCNLSIKNILHLTEL